MTVFLLVIWGMAAKAMPGVCACAWLIVFASFSLTRKQEGVEKGICGMEGSSLDDFLLTSGRFLLVGLFFSFW